MRRVIENFEILLCKKNIEEKTQYVKYGRAEKRLRRSRDCSAERNALLVNGGRPINESAVFIFIYFLFRTCSIIVIFL